MFEGRSASGPCHHARKVSATSFLNRLLRPVCHQIFAHRTTSADTDRKKKRPPHYETAVILTSLPD